MISTLKKLGAVSDLLKIAAKINRILHLDRYGKFIETVVRKNQ